MQPNKPIERKDGMSKVLDVDEKGRRVKIEIASIGDIDRDDDVFEDGAFDRSIAERGPKGTKEIWHMLDHGTALARSLSKPAELYVESKKLIMVSPYRENWNWREIAWPGYVSGDIDQHSVGFTTAQSINTQMSGKTVRVIKQAILFEGSAVTWGANSNTHTQTVYKSFFKDKELGLFDRLQLLYKHIKEGKYNEDNAELLQIELKDIELLTIGFEQKSKQAPGKAESATDTQALAELMESVKSFQNILN